jgi:phage terminase small subunit
MPLTIKQEKFCNKYIETGNASEAYRSAYNSGNMKPEVINNKASLLLSKGAIRVRVSELQKELKSKSDITKEDLLEELKAITTSDIRDYVKFTGNRLTFKPFKELTDKQAKAIESIKKTKDGIELKLHGKSWSIERVCKMLGFDAPTKNEVTGKDGKELIPQQDLSKLSENELRTLIELQSKSGVS